MKDKNEQHHLSDADLEKLTKKELIFLVEHERGHFNEVADRLLNTLIGTERELRKWQELVERNGSTLGERQRWQDELVDHIDTATSKIFDSTKGIDTNNWKQKKEDDNG